MNALKKSCAVFRAQNYQMVLISMFGMFAMRQMSWKRYTSRLSHNRHTHTHFITTNPRVCAHAHCTLFERRSVRAHFRIIFFLLLHLFCWGFCLFLSFSVFLSLFRSTTRLHTLSDSISFSFAFDFSLDLFCHSAFLSRSHSHLLSFSHSLPLWL